MARLHYVKKARKANKEHGIKKGDSYYWWKFAFGAKRVSKTRPPRSALTQSEFYGALWDAEDAVSDAISTWQDGDPEGSRDAIQSALQEAQSMVEDQQSQCDDKISGMESAFPNGCPTLELLQERRDFCDDLISELQNAESEVQDAESQDEAESAISNISWDCP